MRGGEKVLEALCLLFPQADLFTLVHHRGSVSATIESRRITTSFVQRLPGAHDAVSHLPPALPRRHRAVRPRRLRPGDQLQPLRRQVGGRAGPRLAHLLLPFADAVCLGSVRRVLRAGARGAHGEPLGATGRCWPAWPGGTPPPPAACTVSWPTRRYVAGRIRRYYDRESVVVYPPIDTDFFLPSDVWSRRPSARRFRARALQAGRPRHRRVRTGRRARCASSATGPTARGSSARAGPAVTFLGRLSDDRVRDEYQQARATILAGEEDFGMVPVEAQACGRPVVALARGGALETVQDGDTGLLFDEPTAESLADGHHATRPAYVLDGPASRARRSVFAPAPSGCI